VTSPPPDGGPQAPYLGLGEGTEKVLL